MYNLNVSLTAPLLGVDGGGSLCSTPRTPEILNSLIAMTNPLEYSYAANSQVSHPDSPSSCSASPLDSPAGNTGPPSVQQMCSQLIKASLKQSIQSKRKLSSGDSSSCENYGKFSKKEGDTTDDDSISLRSPKTGVRCLTPEDEDRRRRRRERNKIAATKCRMKKREKTLNLVQESETLENQNVTLKTEVRDLETQRQKLVQLLEAHTIKCVHHNGYQTTYFQSPALKYLPELNGCSNNQNGKVNINNNNNNNNNQETLKFCQTNRKHQPPNSIHFCKNTLPPGYCKPSPTNDINYTLSPSNGFIESTKDITNNFCNNFKTDYIPNCENSNTGGRNSVCSGIDNCDGGTEFINLKTELQDSTSPYTTVQSANRFLFENSEHFIENDRIVNTQTPHIHIKDNRNTPILEFNGNIQSFDTTLIKNDFLQQTTDFLDTNDTQFTDLDSGITTYTNVPSNNGCLV